MSIGNPQPGASVDDPLGAGISPVKTLGESRVLVTYRDDAKLQEDIAKIREISASLIDLLQVHKTDRTTTAPLDGEIARVYATAMTEIEGACMWSIKAICK